MANPCPSSPMRWSAGTPDVVEDELGVATVVMVVVAEDLHPAHDLDPRGGARGR
jgi:hypothetical protein